MDNNTIKLSGGTQLLDAYKILENAGLGQGMTVASLGCGAMGHLAIPAAKVVGDSGMVYAVDILKSVLSAVEGRAKFEGVANVKTVWSNLEVYKGASISDASLDMAFLSNILFQADKKAEVVKEAARMIKPGGSLIVVDWVSAQAPLAPPPAKRIKKEQVQEWAKAVGLKLMEEFIAGSYHYGLIFQKTPPFTKVTAGK